ncbi:MAG: hypothetical protein M1825_004532 [Sarcosagium campestre]|nr:MAG: hypothetical protein M1825_004532 [Sarcosagium campestre]
MDKSKAELPPIPPPIMDENDRVIVPHIQVLPISDDHQKALDALPGMEAACTTGNLDAVHELHCGWLASTKPEAQGLLMRPWLWGAVSRAIENDQAKVLTDLLSNGDSVSPIERGAATDIARAVKVRSTACLEAFLDRGWNINERTGRVYPAALREMMEWFLAHKASPNATCDMDRTPLSHACVWGSLDAIQFLFERGGSVEHGQLLLIAARRDKPDRVELLNYLLGKGASINAIEYENCPDVYQTQYWRGFGTALHNAAGIGYLDAVQFLLSRGADPLIKDSKDDGRVAKNWAEETLNTVRCIAAEKVNPAHDDASPKIIPIRPWEREWPHEEVLCEIIRLLEPSWWTMLVPRRHFTDGKRFSFNS